MRILAPRDPRDDHEVVDAAARGERKQAVCADIATPGTLQQSA
jgi:hypothetical protein